MTATQDTGSGQTARQRPPVGAHPQHDSPMRHLPSQLRLWLVALVGVAIDLGSKDVAFNRIQRGERVEVVEGLLRLELSVNSGALFGWGSGLVTLFVVASLAALGFVIYLFSGSTRKHRALHVALGLILAGALGNLYDRSFIRYDMVRLKATDNKPAFSVIGEVRGNRNADPVEVHDWGATGRPHLIPADMLDGPIRRIGVVRDFIKITPIVAGIEIWPWVFNVADVYLVVGVGLLLLLYFLEARRQAAFDKNAPAEPSAR